VPERGEDYRAISASVYELTQNELTSLLETRPEAFRELSRILTQQQATSEESKVVESKHPIPKSQIET
jgi:hypothetical protein